MTSSVLIVEPNAATRQSWADALVALGLDVQVAAGGNAGYEALMSGTWDVLVTAIFMPDVDGLELINTAVNLLPGIRVVAVGRATLAGRVDYLEIATTVGAHAAIRKPATGAQIAETVEAVLAEVMVSRRGKLATSA